jgi:hypothetical protein
MENLALGHSLGPDAREINRLVGQEILRWVIHIATFLVIIIAVFPWRHETDREVQREQVCGILEGEILRGGEVDGFQGTEERKMWFWERLGGLQVRRSRPMAKTKGKGRTGCTGLNVLTLSDSIGSGRMSGRNGKISGVIAIRHMLLILRA